MTEVAGTVFVVDDDPAMREGLESLIRAGGWRVATFASAGEFLGAGAADGPSCLILDVGLPEVSGLELQDQLASVARAIPIVFVTGCEDVSSAVRAMKGGAVDFLTKPFRKKELVEAIRRALDRSRAGLLGDAELRELRERHASLSPRQKQVLALVVKGLANKEVAARLEIEESTVKAHRARIMQGMNAGSFADLVRMAERLEL